MGSGSSGGRSKGKGGSGLQKSTPQFVSTFNDDGDSDIEVLELKPPPKRSSKKKTALDTSINDYGIEGPADADEDADIMQVLLKSLDDDNNEDPINFDDFSQKSDTGEVEANGGNNTSNMSKFGAGDLADGLDSLATLFDSDLHDTVRPDSVEE